MELKLQEQIGRHKNEMEGFEMQDFLSNEKTDEELDEVC